MRDTDRRRKGGREREKLSATGALLHNGHSLRKGQVTSFGVPLLGGGNSLSLSLARPTKGTVLTSGETAKVAAIKAMTDSISLPETCL